MSIAPQARYPLVQALRAIAALAVVLLHVVHDSASLGPAGASVAAVIGSAMPWMAGVDVFFVISGFVMLHASEALFGQGLGGVRTFVARRVARIVPLYWAATTLFLLVAALDPKAVAASLGGARYILASYLFIPFARPDGLVQPPIGLGWTLNYEMFFYLVFVAGLWLSRRGAILSTSLLLIGLVTAGSIVAFSAVAPAFWSEPIILEFLFGIWIRAALPSVGVLPGWARLGLVIGAVLMLRADMLGAGMLGADRLGAGMPRVVAFGVPAAMAVVAAVTGSPGRVSAWSAVAVRIGDASYALYLLHPFVMRAISLLWRRVGLEQPLAAVIFVLVSLLMACVLALAVNAWAEAPATRYVRRWLEPSAARRA